MTDRSVKRGMLIAAIVSAAVLTLLAIGGLIVMTRGPHAESLPRMRTMIARADTSAPAPLETAPALLFDTPAPVGEVAASAPADPSTATSARAPDTEGSASATGGRSGPTGPNGEAGSADREHDDASEEDDHEREVIGPTLREHDETGETED